MGNINRWGLTDGMRLARTVGRFLRDPSRYTTPEFIQAGENAAKVHPNEWVVFYSLGTKYLELGQFARALNACKRVVELKPDDIRSAYALATIYNTLTTSDFATRGEEFRDIIALLQPPPEAGPFDPNIALAEMSDLGMVADTAAARLFAGSSAP